MKHAMKIGVAMATVLTAGILSAFECSESAKARVVRHPSHPTILHSVWRAKDGRVAAVLCNWSRAEQKFALSTPDITAPGTIPVRSWRIVMK